MVITGFSEEIFTKAFWQGFGDAVRVFVEELGVYLGVYLVEGFVIVLLSTVSSTLFIFCCITFASIIAKKAKVLTAIAIYYVANGILSFVVQIFTLFVTTSLEAWVDKLPLESTYVVFALIALGLICCFSVFCAMLYTLQHWMMDRKLNLS